jgi:hypothetical protein
MERAWIATMPGASLTVFAVALTLNIAWFALHGNHVVADSPEYLANAESIVSAGVFLGAEGVVETRRTPGYPLLLALLIGSGGSLRLVVIFQHLLVSLVAVGTYVFARSRLEHVTAFTAALFVSAYLPSIIIANMIMAETLFAAAVFVMAVATMRAMERGSIISASVAGLVGGAAVLIRPIGLYACVPVAFLLLLTTRRCRVPVAVTFMILYVATPVLWAARNHARTGVFTVSSVQGEQLLFWKAAGTSVVSRHGALWGLTSLQLNNGFFFEFRRMQEHLRREADQEIEMSTLRPAHEVHPAVASRVYAKRGIEILEAHPLAFSALAFSGFVHMWLDGYWEIPTSYLGFDFRRSGSTLFLVGCAGLFLCVLGVVSLSRREPRLALLIAVMMVYFTAVAVGPESDWRFTVPVVPFYAIAVAEGVRRTTAAVGERLAGFRSEGEGADRAAAR